jgi:hypothetical protein
MKAWAQLDLSGQSGDPELIQAWFLEGFAHGHEAGIEECAQRSEAYSYMSPNFLALAEELRKIK